MMELLLTHFSTSFCPSAQLAQFTASTSGKHGFTTLTELTQALVLASCTSSRGGDTSSGILPQGSDVKDSKEAMEQLEAAGQITDAALAGSASSPRESKDGDAGTVEVGVMRMGEGDWERDKGYRLEEDR